MKKYFWVGVALILVGGLLVWRQNSAPTPLAGEPIKIGYIGPFTGPVAGTSGEDVANGWKLAVSKRPGAAGRPIEVIYEDDACDPKQAVNAAQKLINIDKVNIVVNGVCSGSMVAVAPLTEAKDLILFTPVSTSPKISDAGEYVFRTSGTGVNTASALVSSLEKFGHTKVAVLFEKVEYPIGIKDPFVAMFSEKPGNAILIEEGVNVNETDMRSQLSKVAQTKPQALVVLTNSAITANTFVKQAKELGIAIPTFANEYFAFDVVVSNPDAEGIWAAQYKYEKENQDYINLLRDYEAEYGKRPSQAIYAALPFDGYNVLLDAIDACGGDEPACVKDALHRVENYKGITGAITINDKGDTDRVFVLRQLVGGKFVD
ncbi:MAG: ABC transporter substrate-binding protein [Candidatus Paceibacterota bacterium]